MFKKPFSFEGRIRRKEYGLSILAVVVGNSILGGIIGATEISFLLILMIPLVWFIVAQAAKRCHDVGNSGWWQLIPFYAFIILFIEGDAQANQYGENPKAEEI